MMETAGERGLAAGCSEVAIPKVQDPYESLPGLGGGAPRGEGLDPGRSS